MLWMNSALAAEEPCLRENGVFPQRFKPCSTWNNASHINLFRPFVPRGTSTFSTGVIQRSYSSHNRPLSSISF
jgi:hypothetical protein